VSCAGADVGRTLKARSGVIQAVHDALHELGIYKLETRDTNDRQPLA